MGFIIIIPIAALAVRLIYSMFRRLRGGDFNAEWRRAFAILSIVGLALGIWFAFFFQYTVGNYRLQGFPIPAGIAIREKPGAPWQTSTMPLPVRIGAMTTNLLSGVALCLLPMSFAAFIKENQGKGPFTNPNSP